MKQIKILAFMLLSLTFALGFTACGDDDDNDEPDIPNQGNTNNNSGSSGESNNSSSSDDIKSYVNATCSYKDYYWYVSIASTLESQYPGKSTTYSVGYAPYNASEAWTINPPSGQRDLQSYTQRSSEGVTYVEIVQPFYYFFIALAADENTDEYNDIIEMSYRYLRVLRELSEKSSLTSEERALRNDCIEYLDKQERQARLKSASIFVFANVTNVGSATLGNYRLP